MEILWTCGEEDEGRVVKDIARKRLHLSGALWKRIKWNGTFSLNGQALHNAKTLVKAGDVLRFSWSEESDIIPSDIPLDILYEDKDLLIVNKGPGMIIHPTSKEAHDTLVNAVAGYFQKKGEESGIHPVYRLDRNTTGIVVVAKSAKGQYELSKSHDVLYREYLALVSGNMEGEGTIEAPIGRRPGSIVEWMVREDGKWAATEYKVLASSEKVSLLRLHLLSGRTHQIRVHCTHLGHPLLGDTLYGGPLDLMDRQGLHAFTVAFNHPETGEKLYFKAPVPEDMKHIISTLWPDFDFTKEGLL